MKPLVSVIINCYNSEKYLRETIDSVIAQTYKNWEIIFWDNQSTDKSAEIVESYKDLRIKYFYASEHTELGQARNLAIQKAAGSFISFIDADDLWESGFLTKGIDVLLKDSELGGYYSNGFNLISGIKHQRGNISEGKMTIRDIVNNYHIDVSGCIIRVQTIHDNNIQFNNNYLMIEDFDFFVRIASFNNFYADNSPLMCGRIHYSTTYRFRSRWYYEYKDLYEIYQKLYGTSVLDLKSLSNIRYKMIVAKMDVYIENNSRLGLICHFVKHPSLLKKYWKRILFVFIGRDRFVEKLKNRLLQ